MVVQYALNKNKIPALTETGLEKITNPDWFTGVMWNNIKTDSIKKNKPHLLVWRNAHLGHFYAPYRGHSSVPNFKL